MYLYVCMYIYIYIYVCMYVYIQEKQNPERFHNELYRASYFAYS